MVEERPGAVILAAAWLVLVACIYFFWAYQYGSAVLWIGLAAMGVYHLATAVGLYYLCEWARRRAVQVAIFDILAMLQHLFPHPYPFGLLLGLGMPLYTITVLSDQRIRQRFS